MSSEFSDEHTGVGMLSSSLRVAVTCREFGYSGTKEKSPFSRSLGDKTPI